MFENPIQYSMQLMQTHPASALLILAFTCALSATFLPLPSEGVFFVYHQLNPNNPILSVLFAGLGNTVGGLISYYMGLSLKRFLEKRKNSSGNLNYPNINTKEETCNKSKGLAKSRLQRISVIYARNSLKKFGTYMLLLSWLPIVGDLLCFFAGYFRLRLTTSLLMMFIGKTSRYLILLQII